MRYYIIALFAIILDQYTKWLVLTKMQVYTSVSLIDTFFYITSHRNRGAAFGILQNKWFFFITITSGIVVLLIYYIYKLRDTNRLFVMSLSLILGGAIGNLIDRITHGEVIDFLDFRFGIYHFPIFNVADSVIVIGVSLLVILCVRYPQLITDKDTKR